MTHCPECDVDIVGTVCPICGWSEKAVCEVHGTEINDDHPCEQCAEARHLSALEDEEMERLSA
jgi:hypothetical protein